MKKCFSEIHIFFFVYLRLEKNVSFYGMQIFFSFPKITFEVQKEFLFRHF